MWLTWLIVSTILILLFLPFLLLPSPSPSPPSLSSPLPSSCFYSKIASWMRMCVLKLQTRKPHLVNWHMLMINKWRKSKPSILPLQKNSQIHNTPFNMSGCSCLGRDLEFFKGWDLVAVAELIKVTEMAWAILLPLSWFTDSRITVTALLWKRSEKWPSMVSSCLPLQLLTCVSNS